VTKLRENGSFAIYKHPSIISSKGTVYCTIMDWVSPNYAVRLVGDRHERFAAEANLEDLETPEFKRGDRVLYKPDEQEDFEEREATVVDIVDCRPHEQLYYKVYVDDWSAIREAWESQLRRM